MAPLSIHAVAAAVRAREPGVDRLKLHKLLYYIQGHHMADFGEPLFSDTLSAFDHGPVVARLWYAEANGEAPPVSRPLTDVELSTVGYVMSQYGHMTGPELEDKTHDEPPWQRADAKRSPGASERIRDEWVREFFAEQVPPTASRPSEIALAATRSAPADLSSESDDLSRLRAKIARRDA